MKKLSKLFATVVLGFALAALVACAPKNVEKAKAKMKDAGYICSGYEYKGDSKVDGAFIATKITSTATFILFDSASDAKKYAKELKEKNIEVSVAGKWACFGSEEVIKAFKK